ncbi:MAG: hypothetical protein ACTSVI_15940 [Promethearchaeota archaeon]
MNVKELLKQADNYKVILKPDKDDDGWWAGAPSILKTSDGSYFLAARMRDAINPRGRRGYEIRILKSKDGENFRVIKKIKKEDVGIHGFERPALIQDPVTKKLRLYGCGELDDGWGIWKLDDVENIEDLDPSTFKIVLHPQVPKREIKGSSEHHSTFRVQYKDPFIIRINDSWHMFVIGFDRIERIYHFNSRNGDDWSQVGDGPILDNVGWHDFYTRPACLFPLDIGYLLIYEGSSIKWNDPGYNIATGLAFSLDLENFIDLTPRQPLFKSTTPGDYHSWRYSHWIKEKDRILIYFEASRPNNSNEIRLLVLPI